MSTLRVVFVPSAISSLVFGSWFSSVFAFPLDPWFALSRKQFDEIFYFVNQAIAFLAEDWRMLTIIHKSIYLFP